MSSAAQAIFALLAVTACAWLYNKVGESRLEQRTRWRLAPRANARTG